ncbi:hypothetical protein H920_04140 [Fukomys damarensis]|uniref:Uncharacterized protein n=1 Tax=Fukomys damarensis TaxID=885580 RepID=A0A091DQP8_FUKDA|nr:hypothetical protein H920_04140 [Fukomys damarensis]
MLTVSPTDAECEVGDWVIWMSHRETDMGNIKTETCQISQISEPQSFQHDLCISPGAAPFFLQTTPSVCLLGHFPEVQPLPTVTNTIPIQIHCTGNTDVTLCAFTTSTKKFGEFAAHCHLIRNQVQENITMFPDSPIHKIWYLVASASSANPK